MKLFCSLLLFCGTILAQVSGITIIQTTSNPTGNPCSATSIRLLTPTGTLYTCQSGSYAAVGGGSGGGSVTQVNTGTGLTGGPITTTGTISLVVPVVPANGGTGVVNTGTITVGGNTAFTGAFTFAGTLTGNTAVTFPTSGTLATTTSGCGSGLTTGNVLIGLSSGCPTAPGDINVSSGTNVTLTEGAAVLTYTGTISEPRLGGNGNTRIDASANHTLYLGTLNSGEGVSIGMGAASGVTISGIVGGLTSLSVGGYAISSNTAIFGDSRATIGVTQLVCEDGAGQSTTPCFQVKNVSGTTNGSWTGAGSLTSINATLSGLLNIIKNVSAGAVVSISDSNSGLTAGQEEFWQIGHDGTNGNLSQLKFHYAGSGNTGNYMGIGFFGTGALFSVAYSGAVTTPNNTLDDGSGNGIFTGTVKLSSGLASQSCLGTNSSSIIIAGTCTGSSAFSTLTSGTNSTAAMVVGTGASLVVSGSGTIAATTAAALTSTPTLCSTGNAPTGILSNGNATGCASITGGSGLPITANGSSIATATTLNFQSGTYITQSVTNASGVITYQPDVDTTQILTYTSFQTMGSVPLTTTSASSSTYTANAAVSASTFVNSNNQALVWNVGSTACASGAKTLAINGLTARGLKKSDGTTDLATTDCAANTPVSLVYDATLTVYRQVGSSSSGSSAFSAITTSTNSTATMTVGTGASMTFSGSGVVNANQLNGTTFSGTNGNLVGFGASNIPVDSLISFSTTGTTNTLNIPSGSTNSQLNFGTTANLWAQTTGGNLTIQAFNGVTIAADGFGLNIATFGQSFTDPSSVFFGKVTMPLIATSTNCASGASPAVCSAAPDGAVAIPTGVNPTLVVNTTVVTANSRIFLTVDDTVTIAGTTCNSTLATLVGGLAVTARTAGTSFTISYNGTITTNPVCLSYKIEN